MTQWIFYSTGVALLLGAAARAAEVALRAVGRPARGVWLAALAGSLLLPAYAAAGGPLPGLLPFPALAPAVPTIAAASPDIVAPVPARASAVPVPWFPLAWALASAALLGLLFFLELRLRRERRGWIESAVDGVPVLVSRDVGPAVAGLVRGRIVLPTWALRLDAPVVRAIVAHEAEHVRAGDPRTLLAGLLAVCLVPWNPALWWQYRRLTLAVELDCDARVLAALRDPRAYGLALLETARRRSRGALLHAALLRPRSFLQRRIEMMGRVSEHRMTIRALASAGIAAVALVAAVCADSPAEPEARAEAAVKPAFSVVEGPAMGSDVALSVHVDDSVAMRVWTELTRLADELGLEGERPPLSTEEVTGRLNRMEVSYEYNPDLPDSVFLLRLEGVVSVQVEGGKLRFIEEPESNRLTLVLSPAALRPLGAGSGWTLAANSLFLER